MADYQRYDFPPPSIQFNAEMNFERHTHANNFFENPSRAHIASTLIFCIGRRITNVMIPPLQFIVELNLKRHTQTHTGLNTETHTAQTHTLDRLL